MTLPSVTLRFLNGGLGIVAAGAGRAQVKVGISAGYTPNTVAVCSSKSVAKTLLKAGPLCDAVINQISISGATVYAVPCVITDPGEVGSFTLTGSGTGAVTATSAPHVPILVKVYLGGSVGTAHFQFSVAGGAYSAPVTSEGTSWDYRVPGTFTTLTFAMTTYRTGDVYSIPTTGVVSASTPSGGPNSITQVSSPVDAYQVQVDVLVGGARGTATFTYSLDGGNVVSSPLTTAATYIIPGAGIVLAFSNYTYVAGDLYDAVAIAAGFSSSSAADAIDAALADSNEFEGVHIVGTPASAADAVTMATMLDGKVQGAETELLRYLFGVSECPTVEADATVKAAVANFTSTTGRTSITVGDADVLSRDTALTFVRNAAWPYCARLASTKLSEHPGKVLLGALPGVSAIYTAFGGGAAADTFDSARFVTLRTIRGIPGYYVTRGNTMDLPTSDYSYIQNVRVVDRAATVAQAAFTTYLNNDWRIDPDTGHLDARDANQIESNVLAQLNAALTGEPGSAKDEVSSIGVVIDPNNNLLSDKTLQATISITPKGYSEQINVDIGFVNPLVQA